MQEYFFVFSTTHKTSYNAQGSNVQLNATIFCIWVESDFTSDTQYNFSVFIKHLYKSCYIQLKVLQKENYFHICTLQTETAFFFFFLYRIEKLMHDVNGNEIMMNVDKTLNSSQNFPQHMAFQYMPGHESLFT